MFVFLTAVSVRAWEFGLARQVRPDRPASARSFSTLKPNLVLTHGITPYTFNRHRVSPELIGTGNCVPMEFTAADSSPAQGQ